MIGVGGAAISLSFDKCYYSTSIEVKFSHILIDEDFQMWGPLPMKRNLYRVLYRWPNGSGYLIS